MEGKKPIAERLREACKSEPFRNDSTYDIKVGESYVNLSWDEASNLAEEIEAEQKAIIDAQGGVPAGVIKVWADNSDIPMEEGEGIPSWLKRNFAKLPCDKAGEPWHIGDETDKGKISGFTVHELYPVPRALIHTMGMDHHATAFEPGELERVEEEPVLDADGVEIKVGDTVWELEHGYEYSAIEVEQERIRVKHHSVTAYETHYKPSQLTHEKPVFDAEGVRICNGDTVWHVYTGQKATVTTVYSDDRTLVEVEIAGHLMDYEPSDLTHRESDSLEKLRDDMESILKTYGDHVTDNTVIKWKDRLTALMERDA